MKQIITICTMIVLACTMARAENTRVTIRTNYGEIQVELFNEQAPATVKNFLSYVDRGFYNGTIFHRVIPNFMIQGGGYTPGMVEKATMAPVRNEAGNGLPNRRGTLAMARTMDPHSATAQFFINVVDNPFLNYRSPDPRGFGYCVFGRVISGIDVVDRIKSVATKNAGLHQDVPVRDVVINSIARK